MAKTKKFKTESQKLLRLMTHSIYTQKEIFLRELISNASDAMDKRHYLSLTDSKIHSDTYEIMLEPSQEKRTLSIRDNGIGFTEDELIHNLGTIAQSGSQQFLEQLEAEDLEMIGQFGVGFYSAFMVAKKVEVFTKSPFAEKGLKWSSTGESSYTISEIERTEIGTEIVLHLLDDDKENEENYSKYLDEYTLRGLVKKHSDYVRYPIVMMVEETVDEKKTIVKETLNQMVPIWKKAKADIEPEAMNEFYKRQFHDYEDPIEVIHSHVEGLLTYTALLFIPKKPPYDFYSEKYEKGLQLYSKGVFIQDKNKDLLPDHFKFVKGLIDSQDISLNISREMLQQNRQVKQIANHLEKKIKSELETMLKNNRERYIEFYDTYKITLKYGMYDQFGAYKDQLKDLILFKTSQSDDYITLKEYLDRKPEAQKTIYYATGKTKQSIMNLPQMDVMKDKGHEVLLFTDDIDEFMIQVLGTYNDVPFKSVQQGEADFIDENQQKEVVEKTKANEELLTAIQTVLKDEVKEVKLTARLKDSPVCIVSGEGVSLEMEKVLAQIPNQEGIKAERILEINPEHPLFQAIQTVYEKKEKHIDDYAILLYHQALLLEGLPIEDPTAFTKSLVELMIEAAK
ncbi:MAG: molecular chaperone HtpG [Acholeplasmataceae bacterium]|nr:molecular chaperone HtpG [Acholeplasmataceae bacterium]